MSEVTISRSNASRISIGKRLDQITGVRLYVGQDDDGDDIAIEVGNDTGYVLEVENPAGNTQIAYMILSQLMLRGFRYQAYEANARIDPAAEIGDTVTVDGNPSVIYSMNTVHSALMISDASAPFEEEVNHEYKFESKQEREYKRQIGDVRATLSIQADEIAAKVSETGGNNASFGWSLKATEFALYAGNTKVFYVNEAGAHVQGEITATSGTIGGCQIVNGVLKVEGAHIDHIDAGSITTGYMNGVRVAGNSLPGDSIVDHDIPTVKYGYCSVTGGGSSAVIAESTVSTYNTSGNINQTLTQVGTNTANISTIQGYFTGFAQFSSLDVSAPLGLSINSKTLQCVTIDGMRLVAWSDD